MTLTEELERAPADLSRLTEIVVRHGEPVTQWPDSRAEICTVALRLLEGGEGHKAALVLLAAVEDLGRFHVGEDEDTDAGWHRAEAKRWELWRCCRALRDVLVDADAGALWRGDLLEGIRSLWSGIDADGTFIARVEVQPLSPADDAVLGHEPREDASPEPFEETAARLLCEAESLDEEVVRAQIEEATAHMENRCELLRPAESVAARFYAIRRIAQRLERRDAVDAAAVVALDGLVCERAVRERDAFLDSERVTDPEVRALRDMLTRMVTRGGAPLRARILARAEQRSAALVHELTALLGPGSSEEVAAMVGRLRRARERAAGDDVWEIEHALVTKYGDALEDEEFFSFCEKRKWWDDGVERRLKRGRREEAVAFARKAPPSDLRYLCKRLLQAGEAEVVAQLLAPHTGNDDQLAAMHVQALRAAGGPGLAEAAVVWFRQRPTAQTYLQIRDSMTLERWTEVQSLLHALLVEKRLFTTVVDIAIEGDDIDALNEVVPRLQGYELEHARARIGGPLRTRLDSGVAQHLEPRSKEPAVPAAPAVRPSDPAKPTRVRHPKFGEGRVLRAIDTGDARKYVVAFDRQGERTLLARFLEPISPDGDS